MLAADGGSTGAGVAHLAGCDRCAGQLEAVREMMRLAAGTEKTVSERLPDYHRGWMAALDAAGTASRFSGPFLTWAARGAVAGIAALLLLLPMVGGRSDREGHSPLAGEPSFSIFLDGNDLVIEWPENGDQVHRVYRSTSPADFTDAEMKLVRGSRWVDTDPQPPGVVYYYRVD